MLLPPHQMPPWASEFDALLFVQDVLLQLLPVIIAAGEHLLHEAVELGLSAGLACRRPGPASGGKGQHRENQSCPWHMSKEYLEDGRSNHAKDLPSFPGVTEDVKWGNDLVFSVGGKMFAVVDLEPPYSVAFKCTEEAFGELIERPGIIPAPYLARAMWVQETELGEVLDLRELRGLLRGAYDAVVARLPKSRRGPGGDRAIARPAKKKGVKKGKVRR